MRLASFMTMREKSNCPSETSMVTWWQDMVRALNLFRRGYRLKGIRVWAVPAAFGNQPTTQDRGGAGVGHVEGIGVML